MGRHYRGCIWRTRQDCSSKRLMDQEVLEAQRHLEEKARPPPHHNHHTPSLSPQSPITTSQSGRTSWISAARTRDRDSSSITIGTSTSSSSGGSKKNFEICETT